MQLRAIQPKDKKMSLKDVRKTLVAVGIVVVTALHAALSDGSLALPIASEWVPVVVTAIGAVLVYLVRNGEKKNDQ